MMIFTKASATRRPRKFWRHASNVRMSASDSEPMRRINRKSQIVNREWLHDMDLNHDKQIQSLLCYRYTIGQTGALKIESCQPESSRGIEAGASQNTRRTWTNLLSLAASDFFRISDFGFQVSVYAL